MIGDRGNDVYMLQAALKEAGYTIDVDGIYGRQTERVVRNFQAYWGLKYDGLAGAETIRFLKKAVGMPINVAARYDGSSLRTDFNIAESINLTNSASNVVVSQGTGGNKVYGYSMGPASNDFSWSELGNKASKIFIANGGLGVGVGLDDVKVGPLKVSAGTFLIEELSFEKGVVSRNVKASADIGIDLKGGATAVAGVERKVNYADNNYSSTNIMNNPKGQNSWKVGVGLGNDKSLIWENPGSDNDVKFTLGGTAGLGIAVEAELGVNLTAIGDTYNYIFNRK